MPHNSLTYVAQSTHEGFHNDKPDRLHHSRAIIASDYPSITLLIYNNMGHILKFIINFALSRHRKTT